MCINLYSDDFNRQIEYAILTRDIYALCDVPSAGFCSGVCSSGILLNTK